MNREDEFGCKIQLPPPMPLLASEEKQHQELVIPACGSASSSSSSPGARVSPAGTNDDSVCSSVGYSNNKAATGRRHRQGDSGLNSSDDSVSRGSYNANSAGDDQAMTSAALGTTPIQATPPPFIVAPQPSPLSTPSKHVVPRTSQARPISPALSNASLGMEPKFQILSDIGVVVSSNTNNQPESSVTSPTTVTAQVHRPANADDVCSNVLLPHFSTNLMPPRRFVRASTPTTARRTVPSLLLSTSHHHFSQQPQQQRNSIRTASTLPRHVRIAETNEIHNYSRRNNNNNNNNNGSSTDDDTSSSDDEDTRIFSGFKRGRSAMRNNLRKAYALAQQQQQQLLQQPTYNSISQHQHRRRHTNPLTTIPEQGELLPAATAKKPPSTALSSTLALIYAILLGSVSVLFLVKNSSSIDGGLPLSTSFQGFSHFLLAGSLIVAAVLGYKRLTVSLAKLHRLNKNSKGNHRLRGSEGDNDDDSAKNDNNNNNGQQQQQSYDIVDAENGRLTVVLSSPSSASSQSSSSKTDKITKNCSKFNNGRLRRFERTVLSVICIACSIAYAGSFAETIRHVVILFDDQTTGVVSESVISNVSVATDETLKNCDLPFARQQMVSLAVLNLWQLMLTAAIGCILFSSSNVYDTFYSSTFFTIGIAHIYGSQFHSIISHYQLSNSDKITAFYQLNCSFGKVDENEQHGNSYDGVIAILREVLSDLKPLGDHLSILFCLFSSAFFLRFILKLTNLKEKLNLPHQQNDGNEIRNLNGNNKAAMVSVLSAASGTYSWSRLCIITIGSMLATVSVVWNIAIIVASFTAKINQNNREDSPFLVFIGSSSPSPLSNGKLSDFLTLAGDAITAAILGVSVILATTNGLISYLQKDGKNRGENGIFTEFLPISLVAVFLNHLIDVFIPSLSVNMWLCYSHLIHGFIQTVAIILAIFKTSPLASPAQEVALSYSSNTSPVTRRYSRLLFLLNAFANISLFFNATLKAFGSEPTQFSSTATQHLLSIIKSLDSAYYLIAAFILFRLAK